MSIWRRATKRDKSEPAIVDALRKAGARVYRLNKPFDLLCGVGGRWVVLECKTGTRTRKDQRGQTDDLKACQAGGLPAYVVRTPEDALQAIGACH